MCDIGYNSAMLQSCRSLRLELPEALQLLDRIIIKKSTLPLYWWNQVCRDSYGTVLYSLQFSTGNFETVSDRTVLDS